MDKIKNKKYDYIIVGSGICGSIAAYFLAKFNKTVLLLEAGETRDKDRIEMSGRYARTSRKTPGSPYVKENQFADSPDFHENIKNNNSEKNKNFYVFDIENNKFKNVFKSTYQRITGGSTWHWLGNVPRFIPSDFKMNSIYRVGKDWPITYHDLETYYCIAENEIGVSGNHEKWNKYLGAYRSKSFPMSEIWECYADTLFIKKVDGKSINGKEIRILPTPQARNSENYDGRPACAGNSSCVPICPIQAKYDATVHIKKALKTGNVDIIDNAVVNKLIENENKEIIALSYLTLNNNKVEIDTKTAKVILAANSIEIPRLLLNSGIANSSDQVGRNLMDHAQGYVTALTNEKIYPFRGPLTTSGIDAFRDGEQRKELSAFRISIGNDGWGRIKSPNAVVRELIIKENLLGSKLYNAVEEKVTRMIRMSYSTEVLPNKNNRVTLSDIKDNIGIRKPKISFNISKYNADAFEVAKEVCTKIFNEVGVSELSTNDNRDYSGAGHIMGTTCMGNDPEKSVVNDYGNSHDNHNLYIIGPSVFTTSGTANPTLTAVALTIRTIDHLLNNKITKNEV
ncbi:GMC family oxidoreductase [Winogradskyella flava]|uniref:GMC family oxidoreductase n=1 Tax=Winogradskyella flava TaxID=1884876 RepID=A0A842IT88_9FLAO|nr:GMC family oxidoreductase [Winogradskyella flava]MBC2845074.1 GMC family oxidoreductase [Winogradskyella flava]